MKFTYKVYMTITYIISIIMIFLLVSIGIEFEKDNQDIMATNYENLLIGEEQDRMKQTIDMVIYEIEKERKNIQEEYENIADSIMISDDDVYIGKYSIYKEKDTKIIEQYLNKNMITYMIINNENKRISKTNDDEIKIGDKLDVSEIEDIYEMHKMEISDNKSFIIGIQKKDLYDKVRSIVHYNIIDIQKQFGYNIWFDDTTIDTIVPEDKEVYIPDYNLYVNYKHIVTQIKDTGESVFKYKKNNDETGNEELSIGYLKLYKPYNIAIGIGVDLDDIEVKKQKQVEFYNIQLSHFIKKSIAIGVIIVIILTVNEVIRRKYNEIERNRALARESEIIKNHSRLMEKRTDETNSIIHDFKNHITVIKGLINENNTLEATNYIKNINSEIRNISHTIISKNKIVDIILNEKIEIIKDKYIEFKHDIEQIDFSSVENSDLSIIIGNILDNAIESCMKSNQKLINLKIYNYNKNIIVIKLENSCENKPNIKKNKLITSKSHKDIHGYGMRNVENTIAKYNGNMQWEYNEDKKIFTTVIMIPK